MSTSTDDHNQGCDHCETETVEHQNKLARIFSPAVALKTFTPISGLLLFLGFTSSFSLQAEFVTLFYFLSLVTGGVFVVRSAIRGLIKQRFLNISFLVVIAALGAVYIGEVGEAAAVVFLFALGEFFEGFGIERSKRAVEALLRKSPKVARLQSGETVPVDEVVTGTIVAVRPGEQIPLDGIVVSGQSAVDEAPITGESVPVDKIVDSKVFAGTLNIQGYLEVRVEKVSSDSTFSQIIALIEKAQASRAPTQAFIDSFAKYYTPLVVVVSILTVAVPTLFFGESFDEWLYRALTLLVIACPCALVISTPVAIASAIGGASRHGILIKGGAYLEKLAKIKAVAFDKTRTLTEGRHQVTEVLTFGTHSKEEVIADAAGLEQFSSHPLAAAILEYAKANNIVGHTMDSFENVAGKGGIAKCTVCDARSYIGNSKLMRENAIDDQPFLAEITRLENSGQTVVLVAEANKLIGAIALSDTIRSEAKQVISTLNSMGVANAMVTGDNKASGEYVGESVGISSIYADLLPEDKVTTIQALQKQYGKVAMVGDGVNDAPSLVTSDVGFAIGAGGTDAAIESADITLLSGNLMNIPQSIKLARRTMRTIHVNVTLALGIKVLFLLLIPFGYSNLVFAIAADSGMAIVVILNSLRLFKV